MGSEAQQVSMRVAQKRLRPLPEIPARQDDWENRLIEVIERHEALEFQWGVSDCLILVADCCEALTGVDPMRSIRGYSSEAQARAILEARGYSGVGDALAACFEEIPPARARRGDCGVVEVNDIAASVVVMGPMLVGKSHRGSIKMSPIRLSRAFKIG